MTYLDAALNQERTSEFDDYKNRVICVVSLRIAPHR